MATLGSGINGLPKIDFDESAGRFVYDERYRLKQPNWTYADEE